MNDSPQAAGTARWAGRRWPTLQPWLSTAARLGLAAVLLVAGGLKVGEPQQAIQAVAAYALLPTSLTSVVGLALPWLEIALGLLLLVGLMTRTVAVATAALMVAFVIGIAQAWARGLSIDCGCFGGGGQVAPDQTTYGWAILRDTGFIALAVFLTLWPRSRLSLDARYRDSEPASALAVAGSLPDRAR